MRAAEGTLRNLLKIFLVAGGRQIIYRFGVVGLEREARAIYFPKCFR
jgi:hypothetical protein